MKITGPDCITWHDVLTQKGIESSVSKSFIGFVSWNRREEPLNIGEDITRALSGHRGKIFAKDVTSSRYNDRGLLFASSDISPEVANKVFDIIMDYEQQEVYKM